MIVVVGSRYDPVATALVDAWPHASLCSAEDLTTPGWSWRVPENGTPGIWVIDGRPVPDDLVTGVFVRRSTVYPEELLGTQPEDRAYLAAEAHAFLVFVLVATTALVVNPVHDGVMGAELVRPERWMTQAPAAGLGLAPSRLSSRRRRPRRLRTVAVEVVGDEAFGDAPARSKDGALVLARMLGLLWASFVFDGRHRLVAVTVTNKPGAGATRALGRLLDVGAR